MSPFDIEALMLVWLVARSCTERRSHESQAHLHRQRLWPRADRMDLAAAVEAACTIGDSHMVVGVARIEPDFVYDHMQPLSDQQRQQYYMWRKVAPQVPAHGNLHFWRARFAAPLDHEHVDSDLYDRRVMRKHLMPTGDKAYSSFGGMRLPRWCDQLPRAAVYLPYGWARLLCHGDISSFCLLNGWPFQNALDLNVVKAAKDFPVQRGTTTQLEPIDQGLFADLAEDLREVAAILPAAAQEELQKLQMWVAIAQDTHDHQLIHNSKGSSTSVQFDIIEQVLLADSLRSDASLKSVLESAARILLPPIVARDVIARLREKRILDKASLSRSRFAVGVALMMFWRDSHAAAMRGRGCIWYLMADSSPQFNRDYQVTIIRRISRSALPSMLDAASELYGLWSLRLQGCNRL